MTKCSRPGCLEKASSSSLCPSHGGRTTKREKRNAPQYHLLYNRRGWKSLRARHLLSSPLCVNCDHFGRTTPATDVDHVVPHRGDRTLFFDSTNLQSLCHSCHSRKTQLENKGTPPSGPGF